MNRSNNYEDDTSRIFNVEINQKSKTFRATSRRASDGKFLPVYIKNIIHECFNFLLNGLNCIIDFC